MVLKRKTSAHVVCIDTKKTAAPKRQPTKADLLQELKDMKKLNDTLELENVKNLKVIKILEEKIFFLKLIGNQNHLLKNQKMMALKLNLTDLYFAMNVTSQRKTITTWESI